MILRNTDACLWVQIALGKYAGQTRCYACGAIQYDGQSFADVFATYALYERGLIENDSPTPDGAPCSAGRGE